MKKKIIIITIIAVLVFGILTALRLQKWYYDIGMSGGYDAINEPFDQPGPIITSVTSPGAGILEVQWRESRAWLERYSLERYLLECSEDDDFKSLEFGEMIDSATSTMTIKNLVSGTRYYVRMLLCFSYKNEEWWTHWSDIKSVTVK